MCDGVGWEGREDLRSQEVVQRESGWMGGWGRAGNTVGWEDLESQILVVVILTEKPVEGNRFLQSCP